jgi:outer membrane protein
MKSSTLLAMLFMALFCVSCQSEDKKGTKTESTPAMKIAVISSRDVLTRCDIGAQTVSDIQGKFSDQRIQLGVLEQDIRKLQEEMVNTQGKSPKAPLLQEKLQAYAEGERKLRQEVGQEENVRFKPIADVINKVLDEYAKQNNLSGIQERGVYVYYNPALDITEEIIKRVNAVK